jgi:hypothetical protein
MSHGIVIGTYDSLGPQNLRHGVPSVELNLTVIRAQCGNVPVLVSDDCSPPESQFAYRAVCARFGATFVSNEKRLGHTSGDIAAFGRGLEWAAELELTTLTKLSQRMIFDVPNWLDEDSERLLSSGYGTMTSALSNFGDPSRVRTEAVMMVVSRWAMPQIIARYQPRYYPFWNEGYTSETIKRLIDPDRPFPHYLPWHRLRPIRGWEVPPVYFRQMVDADRQFSNLANQYGIRWPTGLKMIDSILTNDYRC